VEEEAGKEEEEGGEEAAERGEAEAKATKVLVGRVE